MADYAAEAILALINAECEAAINQCNQGHQSGSNFFNDNVIGEEMLNAGAYIMLVGECFDRLSSQHNHPLENKTNECRRCLVVLKNSAAILMSLLLNPTPEASSHLDPRPTIAEAWFLTMAKLVSICQKDEKIAASLLADGVEPLIGDCLSTAISLLFLKDLGSRKAPPPTIQIGMSLDGPHTLALMDFASEAMLLGPNVLSAAAKSITNHLTLHQTRENISYEALGAAIISAGLLRAASGSLAPWAVEGTPLLFRSMHTALGNNCDALIQVLAISTELQASTSVGGISAGQKLAGRYFEKINANTMDSFLTKTREACAKGIFVLDIFLCNIRILRANSQTFVILLLPLLHR